MIIWKWRIHYNTKRPHSSLGYADGTTGTAASTTRAYDGEGHAVTTTTSTSTVSGVTTPTITATGTNSDGSVAFVDVQSTVLSGSSITRTNT